MRRLIALLALTTYFDGVVSFSTFPGTCSQFAINSRKIALRDKLWGPSNLIKLSDTNSFEIKKTPDFSASLSYLTATGIQWTLIFLLLNFLQEFVVHLQLPPNISHLDNVIKTSISTIFFIFITFRSRVFSPLDNKRPAASSSDPVFKDRKRPSWQPPPIAFPIIWSVIAVLRILSSVLIWQSTGSLVSLPVLSYVAHLCIGDTWNTVNNVENRLGTAFLGVLFVLASVYATTYAYWATLPLAGFILAPSAVWLSVATCLIYSIWKLNYAEYGSPSLFPSVEEGPPSKWRLPFTSWNR